MKENIVVDAENMKMNKKLPTNQELLKCIRKPTLPPSKDHGDAKKEVDKTICRDKVEIED